MAGRTWVVVDALQRQPGWYLLEGGMGEWGWAADEAVAGDGAEAVGWYVASSRRRQVLLLQHPAQGLRLRLRDGADPSALAHVRLASIGRITALCRMLLDGAGPGEVIHRAAGLLSGTWSYGLRVAAADLHARHRGPAAMAAEAAPCAAWKLQRRWWPPTSARLLLRPLHQLAGDGQGGWRATGGAPYFLVSREDGGAPVLAGGWYRLRGRMPTARGTHLAPRFHYRLAGREQPFPDQLVLPEPGRRGAMDAVFRFDGDVTELRFDPAVRPLDFRMEGVGLRRLPRVEWMLRLLFGLRDASGLRDWQAIGATALAMASAFRRGGAAGAGALLSDRHRDRGQLHARSYAAWVLRYDTFSRADLAALAQRGRELAVDGPLVTVLLPVYDTPERWLRRCLDSMLAQAYPRWELCIADDASTAPHVRTVLQEYARREPRIRIAWRERNGHIARASNTALEMARGEYIALLDHDDELRPHALLEMVEELRAHPDARLVYSDEDKIDERGRRFQPYFKPDWNPDLLLSQNYLCHFTVIETALARESGGFREGTEGSQDHDLFLRCTAALPTTGIRHVPKVLYHWRAIAGSTALERSAKDYAAEAGLRAVDRSVRAHTPEARVEGLAHGHYRVRWPLPSPQPKVSIIVPTRDRVELLRQCVESVLGKTDYDNFELVVVDNGSRDPDALACLETLRGRERVRVLRHDAPFNFSEINNRAAAQCDGELLCLLNNDIEVIDGDWLREMASQAWRPGVGAVGALLLYPDDSIQHAGVVLGLGGVANHAYCHQPFGVPGHGARALVAQELSAVTAACLVVRRQAWLQAGGLDEKLQVAFNDIDFCLRLRAMGYRNVWTPFARLYHHESASRGAEDTPEKVARFHREVALMRERWGQVLDHDPAYNPNLSLEMEDTASELAFPPREPVRGANRA